SGAIAVSGASPGYCSKTSRIEPSLAPGPIERFATELEPVMPPERPLLPELDPKRPQAIASPVRRSWDGSQGESRGVVRDRLLERVAAFERCRLFAGPGADLGQARTRREVSVLFRVFDSFHRAAQAHLAIDRLPMKEQRGFLLSIQLVAFLAVDIGVEHKPCL